MHVLCLLECSKYRCLCTSYVRCCQTPNRAKSSFT